MLRCDDNYARLLLTAGRSFNHERLSEGRAASAGPDPGSLTEEPSG